MSVKRQEPIRPALLDLANPPATCCARCPSALWHRSATDLLCYCQVSHSLTWSQEVQLALIDCDGLYQSDSQQDGQPSASGEP